MQISPVFGNQHSDELSAFIAIAETGSFAEAALRLGRHPSIMSKRMAALEGRLGIRLIARSTRRIKLTEAGLMYLERVREAARILEDAEQEMSRHASQARGVLRLALPGSLGRLWLAGPVAQFAQAHPAITVNAEYSDAYVDVIAGGFDVCIRVGALPDSSLVATRLCDHRRILCAAPAYLARYGEPDRPSALAGHRLLGHSGLKHYPALHFSRAGETEVVRAPGCFISNDGEALLQAARLGLGILGSSNWLVAQDLHQGRLRRVLADWTFDTASAIYLLRPSLKFPPQKVLAFKVWMERVFAAGPPWSREL